MRAKAEEAQQKIDYYNNISDDPSHSFYPALRDRVKNLEEAVSLLKSLVDKRNKTLSQISAMDWCEERTLLVDHATESLRTSREYYQANAFEEGNIAATIADGLLNLAISFTPGLSWGRDLYEAISGKDLLSRNELSPFNRSMAILGSISFGLGSKIGKVTKVFGRLMKGDNTGLALARTNHLLETAKKAAPVEIPLGRAAQDLTADALKIRAKAENGGVLHRIGTRGKSNTGEKAQFWSLDSPLSPGYAKKFGIPPENILKSDFIETAVIRDGTNFVTRTAPGVDANSGGGIEVVVPEGGVLIKSHTSL